MKPLPEPEGDSVARVDLARVRCYQLLGGALAYPDPDFLSEVEKGTFASELGCAISVAAPDLVDAFAERERSLRADGGSLGAEYLSAFELEMPNHATSLYEGSYSGGANRSEVLLEVKGFLGHFGLVSAKNMPQPEDHLAVELEFMQFLVAKQAEAELRGADPAAYVRAQRDFLERHLAVWLPRFRAVAERQIKSDFYLNVACLAVAFVEVDAARLAGCRDDMAH